MTRSFSLFPRAAKTVSSPRGPNSKLGSFLLCLFHILSCLTNVNNLKPFENNLPFWVKSVPATISYECEPVHIARGIWRSSAKEWNIVLELNCPRIVLHRWHLVNKRVVTLENSRDGIYIPAKNIVLRGYGNPECYLRIDLTRSWSETELQAKSVYLKSDLNTCTWWSLCATSAISQPCWTGVWPYISKSLECSERWVGLGGGSGHSCSQRHFCELKPLVPRSWPSLYPIGRGESWFSGQVLAICACRCKSTL